jgi:hypothetical protein
VVFNNGINPGDFAQWRGYAPTFGTTATNFVTNPYRTTGQTRRNTPLKQGNVNLTYSMGCTSPNGVVRYRLRFRL